MVNCRKAVSSSDSPEYEICPDGLQIFQDPTTYVLMYPSRQSAAGPFARVNLFPKTVTSARL